MSPVQRKTRNVDCSVQALHLHISLAQEERQYYRVIVDGAKASLDEAEGIVHYTFDFAQQLELPFILAVYINLLFIAQLTCHYKIRG